MATMQWCSWAQNLSLMLRKSTQTQKLHLYLTFCLFLSLCASRRNRNFYTFQPFFGHSIQALQDNEMKYSGTSQCMGSTIIEIQPLRPPAVIILKDKVGLNPFHKYTYRLDNRRTFYRTRVRSLAMLVTHWLTNWLTDSLTDCRLVSLIDVGLACEDGNSKLVEVVDDEKQFTP